MSVFNRRREFRKPPEVQREGQTHIAEVARPILHALLPNPQLNLDLELALAKNLLRTVLIYILRFTPNQER